MDDPRAARLVETVLRCYPARWRRRHGEEAAELADTAHQGRDPGGLGCLELPGGRGAGVAYATPRPVPDRGRLRAAGRGLFAGRLGGVAGLGGASQGGQHEPGARTRALPAWLA